MNPPSEGIWCNPPPPGTERPEDDSVGVEEETRTIDRIDPFLKSSEYIRYERKIKSEHSRRRSRSRSRRRRSRSRRRHRRRRCSSSRSRSRSRSRSQRRHRRSRSRSESHSRKSHKRAHRSRSRHRSRSKNREPSIEKPNVKVEDPGEDEDEEDQSNENVFKNDGSFMEMFKKMQEEQQKKKEAEKNAAKNPLPLFGKRRGGKVLKTGMVQKSKTLGQEEGGDAQDAWTLYMKEVKRYKEACCDDDSKTRLLVK